MAITVKDHRTLGTVFGNSEELVRITYNFADDAGTVGAFNLFTAGANLVITDFYANVQTAVVSTGNACVIDVGIVTTAPQILVQDTVQAKWAANAFVKPHDLIEGNLAGDVFALPLRVAKDAVVAMTVKTAALTAGKVEFFFKYHRLGK